MKRDEIQKQAFEAWKKNGNIGTCEVITGLGKTFISLHCLNSMPKNNDEIHLFLAETTSREKDLMDNIEKYDKIFGTNTLKDYNLEFYCYQTVYKWKNKKFGLVIADEIHDALSPEYSKFFKNNTYNAIIGLTATVTRNTEYEDSLGIKYTKGKLLDSICPVVYTYTIDQGQQDGTARKLDINVIHHKLESIKKTVVAGNKNKRFKQTELAAYTYWDNQFKRSLYIQDEELKSFKLRTTSHKRSRILYEAESKVEVVKKILSTLEDRTIVFGNSVDSLLKITPNVVSSRNSDKENDEIRESFDKGEIKTIGSFKKLKQGANLKGLNNCIIMSYYSTEKDIIQRLGRLRKDGEKIGKVFIILTTGTKEEDWFSKMFENIESFNMKHYMSIDDYLKKGR